MRRIETREPIVQSIKGNRAYRQRLVQARYVVMKTRVGARKARDAKLGMREAA